LTDARVAVVIPALNEAQSIGPLVRSMPWHLIRECIVVDNDSTDETARVAADAGARVVVEQRRGYGQACMTGAASVAPTTDIIVFMDGDGSDVPAELPRLIDPIVAGEQDFVIGSRLRGEREEGSMIFSQIFASRLLGLLLRIMYGVRYTDMGPFRAIARSSLERLRMQERTYGWNLEMQMRAVQEKLRVLEVPTSCRRRTGGVSKVSGSLRASIKAASRILGVLFRVGLAQGRAGK
jgi:glycosyltransferase involved in cell wall biosynthesis